MTIAGLDRHILRKSGFGFVHGESVMTTIALRANRIASDPPEAALAGSGPQAFFLLAALYGALVLVLWVVVFRLQPAEAVPPIMWHAHEMIYGFATAVAAGLLIALVPSWSGVPPISEARIIGLAAIWLLGRLAMVGSAVLPPWLVAVVDLAFLPTFAGLVIAPLVMARIERNLPLLVLFAVLMVSNALMQSELVGWSYEVAERGARIGMDVYLLLIAVIGGYRIPVLTNHVLQASASPAAARSFTILDLLSVASMVLYLASDALFGPGAVTSAAALTAAVFNAVRLWFWCGHHVLHAPIAWGLHLGYIWLIVGLLLEAATVFSGIADMAAIHVLSAGAIGTISVALVARAGLSHHGRAPVASAVMVAAYGLVSLAAILRVAALFVPDAFIALVIASGVVWAFGFAMFVAGYLPMLLEPRGSHP
jgi:uncharacterized protein involved in response to NO